MNISHRKIHRWKGLLRSQLDENHPRDLQMAVGRKYANYYSDVVYPEINLL